MSEDKIINMPGVPPTKKPQSEVAKDLRSHFEAPGFMDFMIACAEYDRMRYEAYMKAGFTDAQAMYLVKKETP